MLFKITFSCIWEIIFIKKVNVQLHLMVCNLLTFELLTVNIPLNIRFRVTAGFTNERGFSTYTSFYIFWFTVIQPVRFCCENKSNHVASKILNQIWLRARQEKKTPKIFKNETKVESPRKHKQDNIQPHIMNNNKKHTNTCN